MKKKGNNNGWNRCVNCGKFISYKEMGNGDAKAKWTLEGDITWKHKNC